MADVTSGFFDGLGYPDDYRDPEWDGTLAGFRDVVLPARKEALLTSLNEALAQAGFPDLHFEWEPTGP